MQHALGVKPLRPVELRIGDLRIEGFSRAGDDNWFRIHPPGLAFDVGRGAMMSQNMNTRTVVAPSVRMFRRVPIGSLITRLSWMIAIWP